MVMLPARVVLPLVPVTAAPPAEPGAALPALGCSIDLLSWPPGTEEVAVTLALFVAVGNGRRAYGERHAPRHTLLPKERAAREVHTAACAA